MKTMEFKCRECSSERIAPNVPLSAGGGLLGRLRARVCADCGYTELRTDDPLDLYLAHMRKVEGAGTAAAAGSDREPSPGTPPAANIQCPSCGSVLSAAATSCEVCGWSQEAPAS
jgi:ribosomal protein L40E